MFWDTTLVIDRKIDRANLTGSNLTVGVLDKKLPGIFHGFLGKCYVNERMKLLNVGCEVSFIS